MISNTILKDKELSMKDRGVLCTLYSLPEDWEFSINGISAIVSDCPDSIRASIIKLEKLRYLTRIKSRNASGNYSTDVILSDDKTIRSTDKQNTAQKESTVKEKPSRKNHGGNTVTVNQGQYNTDNTKNRYKNVISYPSSHKSPNSFLNFPQREDYDFEELERKLVKN
ncbi:MAG: hypothetical protein J5696_03830 [Lachnospiraceae bacterium]|nr:hypothetical protein [Lachnospiraceae bacterium]